jgi:tyrosyl-tRNA synthetase
MSIPDEPMKQYFTLLTDLPHVEINRWLSDQYNPRDAKEVLGKAVVSQYHGESAADHAAAEFRRRSSGADPEEIPEVLVDSSQFDETGGILWTRLIVALKLETSTSNARRVIAQGGVNFGPEKQAVTDINGTVNPTDGMIVRVGKRKIARIRLQ